MAKNKTRAAKRAAARKAERSKAAQKTLPGTMDPKEQAVVRAMDTLHDIGEEQKQLKKEKQQGLLKLLNALRDAKMSVYWHRGKEGYLTDGEPEAKIRTAKKGR